jgi:integrase
MTVTLRQRDNGKMISLYLEYYQNRKRSYEYLNLYLHKEPANGKLTKLQKDENKKTLDLADNIRSKRKLELQDGVYGFNNKAKLNGSFTEYVTLLKNKRKASEGNYGNWDSALKHLIKFAKTDVTFSQVDRKWLERFKEYLQKDARTPSNQKLSQNSQSSYFNKIRAALKEAAKEGIIQINPAIHVTGIQAEETERDFLTLDELKAVAKAECEIEILKTAFLFSALTGLRWSDINKLMWSEVQHSKELGYYIRFRQKKTQGAETLPISEQAFKMLGERDKPEERVFKGLKYSAWHNIKLQQWVMRAGVTKTITFHCARHTYATLQLTLGTDIYTVSKLLGHRHLKTTQVYAKIIDDKKKEAANKIYFDI